MYLEFQLDELKNETYSSQYTESFYPSQFSCTPSFQRSPPLPQAANILIPAPAARFVSSPYQEVHCAAVPLSLDFLVLKATPSAALVPLSGAWP